jgi:hypothetical protein
MVREWIVFICPKCGNCFERYAKVGDRIQCMNWLEGCHYEFNYTGSQEDMKIGGTT